MYLYHLLCSQHCSRSLKQILNNLPAITQLVRGMWVGHAHSWLRHRKRGYSQSPEEYPGKLSEFLSQVNNQLWKLLPKKVSHFPQINRHRRKSYNGGNKWWFLRDVCLPVFAQRSVLSDRNMLINSVCELQWHQGSFSFHLGVTSSPLCTAPQLCWM